MKNKSINWHCLYLILLPTFFLNTTFAQPLVAVGTWSEEEVYKPLIAVSQDGGTTWFYPLLANQQPSVDNYLTCILSRSFCNKNICVAVGNWMDKHAVFRPLLAWSKDEGSTWNYLDMLHQGPVLRKPSYSKFYDISCTENFCLAAGIYKDTDELTLPLLARGEYQLEFSWNFLTKNIKAHLPDNFYSGQFNEVSCNKTTCLAVGEYHNKERHRLPLLMRSDKTGKDWKTPALAFQSDFKEGGFLGTLCDESFCFAAGDYYDGTYSKPLLMMSSDKGKIWHRAAIPMPEDHREGILAHISCEKEWCIAAGALIEGNSKWPFLVYSNDAGKHWNYSDYVSNTGLPESFVSGELSSTACNPDLCIASGYYTSLTGTYPLLAISKDKGNTWVYSASAQKSTPLALDGDGMYTHVFCNDLLCLATGNFLDSRDLISPLLAVGRNKGENWLYPESIYLNTNLPVGLEYASFM